MKVDYFMTTYVTPKVYKIDFKRKLKFFPKKNLY